MSESPKDVEVWQSIIKGWEEMFARQVAETEKWHGRYMDLLKEQGDSVNKQIMEFAR